MRLLSPLEQFEVVPLIYLFRIFEFFGLTVSNMTVFAILFAILFAFITLFSISTLKLVPSVRQYVFERLYLFVFGVVNESIGFKGQKYFPFIFSLFFFILFLNIGGLLPFSFTLTSQIVIVTFLSFTSFLGLIIIGIFKHKLNFLSIFFPSEAPLALAFLLVPIEIISVFSRPFSLAIRLFANMTAGHVLLKILAGFFVGLLSVIPGVIFINTALLPCSFVFGFLDYTSYFQYDGFIFELSIDACKYMLAKNEMMKALFTTDFMLHRMLSLTFFPFRGNIDSYFEDKTFLWALYEYGRITDILYPDLFDARRLVNTDLIFNSYFFTEVDSISKLSGCLFTSFLVVPLSSILNIFFIPVNFVLTLLAIILPLIVLLVFVILEFFVAVLQAYVFMVLFTVYLRDMLYLH